MNKNIKLAVAGAVLALSATADAGIIIPAGDWTLDVNGNVNAFYINNRSKDSNTIRGGLANAESNNSSSSSINTGLLPSWLGVTGKSRQNDLDVEFTVSLQPGASQAKSLGGGGGSEFRQAYLSFGDKSWGSIKIGKDLGVFGSDAILSDMTLLGVGSQGVVGAAGGTTTTLGRIGAGYMYADFNGQINYTTPNMSGFQATVGIDQPLNTNNLGNRASAAEVTADTVRGIAAAASVAAESVSVNSSGTQRAPAFVGKASYAWSGDVSGKLWAEAKSQRVDYSASMDERANVWGIGANANVAGFGLTGYYYDGKGAGTTAFLMDGVDAQGKRRDSDGGYIQATYVLPTKTKVGISWGVSKLDRNSGESRTNSASQLVKENEMTTFGVYHPLTKSVNLVGEYSRVKSENQAKANNDSDIISLGGILFF
jgi:predicted porin